MSSSVVTAIAVGVITYLGRVARGKQMSIDLVVGIAGLAVALALVEEADKNLAKKFSALVIIGVLLAHWQIIVEKAGFTEKGVKVKDAKYSGNGVNLTNPSSVGRR